jgi:hypothetical protein
MEHPEVGFVKENVLRGFPERKREQGVSPYKRKATGEDLYRVYEKENIVDIETNPLRKRDPTPHFIFPPHIDRQALKQEGGAPHDTHRVTDKLSKERSTPVTLGDRIPLSDITESLRHQRIFGQGRGEIPKGVQDILEHSSNDARRGGEDSTQTYVDMPIVPWSLVRHETEEDLHDHHTSHDDHIRSHKYPVSKDKTKRRYYEHVPQSSRHKTYDSDSNESEQNSSISQHRNERSLYSLLQDMVVAPEFTESLKNLKILLKRSDLIEVRPPRYREDRGCRREVRFGDYFHDKFGGKASKLRRYLQKLLQYSSQVATDELTRADVIADGPGLQEACLTQLENASRVPLPGFTDVYENNATAQKQRTLDLLVTYVFLFYQEEPSIVLSDLKLEGPMLTGLLDLYHNLNRGTTVLPTKFIEEYIAKGILRATNGQGMALIGNFQGQLRFHKRMEPGWEKDEAKYRRLLFNCCSELTTEAKAVPIPSALTNPPLNTSFRGGGSGGIRRENRTEHVNQAQVSWEDEYELYEEYAALTSEEKPKYEEKGRYDNRDRQKPSYNNNRENQNGGNREAREAYIVKIFCTAPCACCGSSKHPMLSPIRTPDGQPQTSEYVCPVALCKNWREAKTLKPTKLRFAPCPLKFAAVNKHDVILANAALKEYAEKGSGKFREPSERAAFSKEVLQACTKGPAKTGGGTRLVGSVGKEERCNSGEVEYIREMNCNSLIVEETELNQRDDMSRGEVEHGIHEEGVFDGCVIIETYNAQGVTKAPSPLTHSALHLLVASKVEPPSEEEILNFMEKEFDGTISRDFDEYTDNEDTGCWVLMEMTYGAEYIVPYRVVHGRILADTGSTTTLINENFAIRQGLEIKSTGSGQIILRDVNDGTSQLTKQCFLRLTITTVEGELISFTVLAFCTDKLKHDILLGTRDLERYKIDVSSHRGKAKMELPDGNVAFPMLDSAQITHLQKLTLGTVENS